MFSYSANKSVCEGVEMYWCFCICPQLCLRSLTAGPKTERSRSRIWVSDMTPRWSQCSKMSTHTSTPDRRYRQTEAACETKDQRWNHSVNNESDMLVFRWEYVAGREAASPLSPWPYSAWWTCLKVKQNVHAYVETQHIEKAFTR